MRAALALVLTLSACASPDPQPKLQTYGAIFPVCVLVCRATITSAELADGASQTTTNQTSSGILSPAP